MDALLINYTLSNLSLVTAASHISVVVMPRNNNTTVLPNFYFICCTVVSDVRVSRWCLYFLFSDCHYDSYVQFQHNLQKKIRGGTGFRSGSGHVDLVNPGSAGWNVD